MADEERNQMILLELVKQPHNSVCVDCGAPDPEWASYNLGVFVCFNCAWIHRNLSNKVKSIKLDTWEDSMVETMKSNGNAKAREVFEKAVPYYFYRPLPNDSTVLREQWIRAKYERLEFTGETNTLSFHSGIYFTYCFYEGLLWKKGKEKTQFNQRKFVLSETEFTLTYYTDDTEIKAPKAVIHIKDLNAMFQPEKIGHSHGLQLTYQGEHCTRNIYVYHENSEDIVTWFNCLRAVRFAYLKTAYPTGSNDELIPMITRNYLKEGYMEKTGPLQSETFRKRWFVLDAQTRKLFYYKSPLDAEELGAIFIGPGKNNYSVKECVPKSARGNKWKYGVTVDTPKRQYIFMCEEEKEQKEWLSALQQVVLRRMAPQDYATEANMNRKR
uniref:ArfGAP with dual PH domains 2 n=1 Tax=Neogobius melanostomus TaxID=47308 RepID=A0A8C6U8Z9_9GOBI